MELGAAFTDNIAPCFENRRALIFHQIIIDFSGGIRHKVIDPAVDVKLTFGMF